MTTSARQPYPFPKLQTDDDFVGPRSTQKQPYADPTHIAQSTNPWSHLYRTCTLSSSRREVYHMDPKAPRDSLDFVLKATYDHHKEYLKGKNETLVQQETLGYNHGRILKNRTVEVVPEKTSLNHPLKISTADSKESPHSNKNAICGHHTQTTNRGYSRKPDGGNFTS